MTNKFKIEVTSDETFVSRFMCTDASISTLGGVNRASLGEAGPGLVEIALVHPAVVTVKDAISPEGSLILCRGMVVKYEISSLFLFCCLQFKTTHFTSLKAEPLRCSCVFVCLPQEEVKRMRVHVEEVIKENERLRDEIGKTGGVSQEGW